MLTCLIAANRKISIWPLTSSELWGLAIYEPVPILYPCHTAMHPNHFLSLLLLYAVMAKHQPLSHCSQGPQCGVPVIWICLREEVNNIFENSYQQQELALPSLLISVEEGPGLGGVRQAPAWGREAALTHFCAKSWYLITSLPRWWDQFACCFVSHHCHLMSLLPCRKGQGLWQQNTTAGSYWCSHVYTYPAQWFCRSYIIVNHSNLLVSFHYPSMVCIRSLPCVTTHFCPLVSEKVLKIVAGICFKYNFTNSMSLSVYQIRFYFYVTAAGLSCCLQDEVFSLDENKHTFRLRLTLPSVSLSVLWRTEQIARNRTDQLHSATVLPG